MGKLSRVADRVLGVGRRNRDDILEMAERIRGGIRNQTGDANDLLASKGTTVSVDLPSGWKKCTLVDNLYSGMSSVRIDIGNGQIRTVSVRRIKI